MCMTTNPARASAATRRMSGSKRPAETSLTTVAPASRAARATADFVVSMLTGTLVASTNRSTTGRTRRSSSSAATGAAPGRVDSPPMSSASAPCATSSTPCATASFGSRKRPPSENESGVTLTIPMTAGRVPQTCSHMNIVCAAYRPPPASALGRFGRFEPSAVEGMAPDEAHGLGSGRGIVLEHSPDGRGDGQRTRLLHAAHRHAQVLGFDHDEHVRREHFDEPRELRQPGDPTVVRRDVRDVRAPGERDQVMFTVAVQGNVAHHHHLVVVGFERRDDVAAGIFQQPAEDLLVHVGDPPRRVTQAVTVGVFADGLEDLPHGALDARLVDAGALTLGRQGVDAVAHFWASRGGDGGLWSVAAADEARPAPSARVPSQGRTAVKIRCTWSVSSVSCSIRSDASWSSTTRLVSRIWRAASCADSISRRTSASMLAATSSEESGEWPRSRPRNTS